jgi:hypothetical protein
MGKLCREVCERVGLLGMVWGLIVKKILYVFGGTYFTNRKHGQFNSKKIDKTQKSTTRTIAHTTRPHHSPFPHLNS